MRVSDTIFLFFSLVTILLINSSVLYINFSLIRINKWKTDLFTTGDEANIVVLMIMTNILKTAYLFTLLSGKNEEYEEMKVMQ